MAKHPRFPRVLIVDDETGFRAVLSWNLHARNFHVDLAPDGLAALALLGKARFDLVITDLTMPLMDGFALLAEIKSRAPHLPIIVITGFATVETAVELMHQGAADVLLKPFELCDLFASVAQALEKSRLPPQRAA